MSRFLVTAMPFAGHVAPMTAIAASLVSRGHDVRMYTGSAFRERVERTGARFIPWSAAPDFDELDLPATFPRLVGKKGFAQLLVNVQDLFIATAPLQLQDARAEWEREPWDVLVSEESSIGPRYIADGIGCRWVTVVILPLYLVGMQGPPPGLGLGPGKGPFGDARDALLRAIVPVLSAPLAREATRARHAAGLPRIAEPYSAQMWSPQLILASGVPELDDERNDRPPHLHWVGRLESSAISAHPLPHWWRDLDGRRVVHVTQGTLNVNPADLLKPALDALADVDAIVVAATGMPGQETLPFPIPDNARVASFLPYDQLLPRTEVVITNGGWGGTLAALSNGIPLIIAGGDLDKPEVARRVASSGSGINLHTGTPTPAAVRAAFDRVEADVAMRARAQLIATRLATAGGSSAAASLLERFVADH